jgi:hypothetical protein
VLGVEITATSPSALLSSSYDLADCERMSRIVIPCSILDSSATEAELMFVKLELAVGERNKFLTGRCVLLRSSSSVIPK